ncbi:MAG: nitroreductase family protein [Sphingomonadales bacterium]|nr:nitroreductase family protein [Sphingomonadales bacterium]
MTPRTTDTKLDPLFLRRWSPRAFDASDMPAEDLETILDAARFAPSSMNYQPWRLFYAVRGDANWERFLSWLLPSNRDWAQHSSVLIYIASDRYMGAPDKPSHSHSFDAGAAWAMLAMQAAMLGYHSHAMAGVDFKAAAEGLGVPESFRMEAAIALGKIGDKAALPEKLQAREVASDRKPRGEIAYPGDFRG